LSVCLSVRLYVQPSFKLQQKPAYIWIEREKWLRNGGVSRLFSKIFIFFQAEKKKWKNFWFFFSTIISFLTNIDELNTNMKIFFGCDLWLDHNVTVKRSKKRNIFELLRYLSFQHLFWINLICLSHIWMWFWIRLFVAWWRRAVGQKGEEFEEFSILTKGGYLNEENHDTISKRFLSVRHMSK
jgi:hypothetical protein